jgi:hypothetical protein
MPKSLLDLLVGTRQGEDTPVVFSDKAIKNLSDPDALNGVAPSFTTITISHAQLIALKGTVVELVPAPGAGKVIIVEFVSILQNTTAGAYTVGEFEQLKFRYGSATGPVTVSIQTDTFLDDATKQLLLPTVSYVALVQANIENKALVLHHDSAIEMTGGDAANDLKIKISYRLESTGW